MYKTDYPVVAWSALYGLDRPDTETYLKEKILGTPRMTWRPTFRGACGGVNMVPRGVYYEIGGMVECFEGWGGEDNATWGKLMAFGYPFKYIDCHLWHLWHPQTLSRGRDRFRAYEMLNWSKQHWLRYTSEWGCLTGARTDLSITRTPDEDVAEDRNDLIVGPDHAEVHYNLGLAYAQKDMLDDAITEFKRALAIDPDFAGAHGNLGESYRRKDMLDDAITEFKRALAIDPNYAMPHNGLAVSYYQKGDRRKAIRHCRKAMELGIEVHPQLLEALGL
jgi:tetratricopeptide (TPR) repeat protein